MKDKPKSFWCSILDFILREVVLKTIFICFIATFTVYSFLYITPYTQKTYSPIHASNIIKSNTTDSIDTQNQTRSSKYFFQKYYEWVGGVLTGNLGTSASGQKIVEEVNVRLPATFRLGVSSFIVSSTIALIIGFYGCKNKMIVGRYIVYIISTLPLFLVSYFLFGLFNATLTVAILALSLSSGFVNELSQIVENSMAKELNREYIETAYAKGLRSSIFPVLGTIEFHAFRNSLITILPRLSSLFTIILSGTIIIEQVFRLQGLSSMLIDGLSDLDMSRVLIVILLLVLIVRFISLVVNLFYLFLNPKYSSR